MNLEQLMALLQAAKSADPNTFKALGVNNTAQTLYNAGGLFSTYALDNTVISTHVVPRGLGSRLPAIPATTDDPRYPFLLGWSDDYGDEPVNKCDDAPKNFMKGGTLTAAWGRVSRETETIEVTELLHTVRGVNTDLRLLGVMLGMDTLVTPEFEGNPLETVIKAQMVGVGVSMERKLAKVLWQGSPGNNTAGGGYKEFPGLDSQIATGQVDAETNTAMPAADSLILDFAGNLVDGSVFDIVEYLSAMEYFLWNLAEQTGMAPVTWLITMRAELWHVLTAVWPCRYMTNRCGVFGAATNPVVINDDGVIRMRDEMRRSMRIDINGRSYEVVIDDGLLEKNNANTAGVPAGFYQSNINFVPTRVKGNFPVAYWEFIDFRNINNKLRLQKFFNLLPFWSDSGRFIWALDSHKTCFDLTATIEPRVILRTPQLAGKILDVRYRPPIHLRDYDPDSPYWVDGGVSTRPIPAQGYAIWS